MITKIDDGYIGLSTDPKPTDNVRCGYVFIELDIELDTQKYWIYSGGNINPVTSNGWWEV